jgi:hypothetical protein
LPRYFFDLNRGSMQLKDHVGVELKSIEAAKERATNEFARISSAEPSKGTLRLEVYDADGKLLATVTQEQGRPRNASSAQPAAERAAEWAQEGELAAELARWAADQRKMIRELAASGRDVTVAQKMLQSVTHLYAGRVARRISKVLESGDKVGRSPRGAGNG